jgi:ABC-type uncharacterized transport system auxiliary subunit
LNRTCWALLLCGALSACVNLPGSDTSPPLRFMLQGPAGKCSSGNTPLSVSVVRVGPGLNNDRIARRDQNTGEVSYLEDVRWVDRSGAMLEQRLASDLECSGYAVLTSHHGKRSTDELVCEVRALNLVSGTGNSAEVALSCVLFGSGDNSNALQTRHSSPLGSWQASAAVAAVSQAYQQVFKDLVSWLNTAKKPV